MHGSVSLEPKERPVFSAPLPQSIKLRSKPKIVHAVQFTLHNWRECEAFGGIDEWNLEKRINAIGNWRHKDDVLCLDVTPFPSNSFPYRTSFESLTALPGDWIAKSEYDGIGCRFFELMVIPEIYFNDTYDIIG